MESNNWNIWNNITFKTTNYVKNFDLVVLDDSIITEHDGEISEIRTHDNKPPFTVGEFGISVWNIKLAVKLGINVYHLLKEHNTENIYDELLNATKKEIDIYQYDKIVLIQNFILHPEFRKRGITDEFIEFIYRGFYDERYAIIALVKPLQDNPIDIDFFLNQKQVEVRNMPKNYHDVEFVPAKTYYSIEDLFKKTDKEINEYKLFALANKCGFNRIGNSHLFIFTPEKMLQRIKDKKTIEQKNNGIL